MRTSALIAVLLAGSLVAPAFARPHTYRRGLVEKVVFQERPGTPRVELSDKNVPAPGMGFVYLTVRSGSITYTGSFYAYRPDDYPLTLRHGQMVSFRISKGQVVECDIHTVMTARWVTQLTLRSPRGHLWHLEIGPMAPPGLQELPPGSTLELPR